MAQVVQQTYPAQQQQYYAPQQPQYMTQNQNIPTTVLYTASGTPVQIVNVNSNENIYEHYQSTSARILGVLQILFGLIILITQIVLTAFRYGGFQGMAGFYSPIFFILAGAFGVQSAKSKSRCSVIATMVLSIFSSILSIAPIGQGSAGVVVAMVCPSERTYKQCGYGTGAGIDTAIAFHSIMLIVGLIEFIVAIVAAVYCCHGCCCRTHQRFVLTQGPGSVLAPGTSGATVAYPYNGGYPAQAALSPGSYPQPNGAWPQYAASAPPPDYQEKIS